MGPYSARTLIIAVALVASVAATADDQDCNTPSMSDETSLLVSSIHIDRTAKEMTQEQEELEQAGSSKLKNIAQTDGSKLVEGVVEAGQIREAAVLDAGNIATGNIATATSLLFDPKIQEKFRESLFGSNWIRIGWQLVFGIVYYLIFVNGREINKTLYEVPNAEAQANFAKGPLAGCLSGGLASCVCAWACTGPHAARTFHMTDTGCTYWGGCISMAFCPCITLFLMHSCTPLEERLGGEMGHKENICKSGLCAAFCSCCVVAHDAANLDKVYGQKTGFCGAEP